MKKPSLLCTGILYACVLSAQPSFQTSLQAGISLPLKSNDLNDTHDGKAVHFGNHLDYSFGSKSVRVGLGAYIGYINSISTDNRYKEIGQAIAERYRFSSSQLTFNSASFKSMHILLGPVASFGSDKLAMQVWAKAGYGLNEPSQYSVLYKEGNIVNNVYSNQAGEHKNGLAYSAGAGVKLAISHYVGLQLAAGYFATQTDQVNYNFDREKGSAPKYYTAANEFIQASAGLQFTIGNPGRKGSSAAMVDTGNPVAGKMDQKIKTKSNIKNDRVRNPDAGDTNDNPERDSLFFSPEKIELGAAVTGVANTRLQSVDNYLTGFVYQTAQGAAISQCGSNAMPGDPVPGIDVRLKKTGEAGSALSARTNKDGSFAFSNIAPGNYSAEAGTDKMDVTVQGNNEPMYRTLDITGGSCGSTKENFIITEGDKTYVEVTGAREAGSGMATGKRDAVSGLPTGKRMHKPYRVADTDFEIDANKIIAIDGKFYAQIVSSRDAGSGLASGRRSTLFTGDIDGDGINDNTTSGNTAGRQYSPLMIRKAWEGNNVEKLVPPDAASGQPTAKRQYQPLIIRINQEEDTYEVVSPRDADRGLATGRRMRLNNESGKDNDIPTHGEQQSINGNPLYEPSGGGSENPLAKDAGMRVIGGDGKEHDVFVAQTMQLQTGATGVISPYTAYNVAQVNWMNPESLKNDKAAKGITEKGIKRSEASARKGWDGSVKGSGKGINEAGYSNKGIQENGAQQTDQAARKGWDGSVKGSGKGINEAGYSDKGIQENGAQQSDQAARKGWDGTVKGGSKGINEAGYSDKGIHENGAQQTDDAARKGWDGTVKGGSKGINQAGYSDKGIQENGAQQGDQAA
ncbi:MAG: carboxypeptidase-like regulatory domain-containing protein, partial [Chitinophagaceae bacterium]